MTTKHPYFILYLLLFLILLFSAGCADKYCPNSDIFLNSFGDFTDDVSSHYEYISDEDWLKLDKEYKHFVDDCYPKYKPDMSLEEKMGFLKNTFSYSVYRNQNDDSFEIDNLVELNINKEIEELGGDAQKELEKYLKDNLGSELEKAVDEILNGLNNLGEEIKDWLKTNEN